MNTGSSAVLAMAYGLLIAHALPADEVASLRCARGLSLFLLSVIYVSVCASVCLCVSVSLCLCVCRSVCLSVFRHLLVWAATFQRSALSRIGAVVILLGVHFKFTLPGRYLTDEREEYGGVKQVSFRANEVGDSCTERERQRDRERGRERESTFAAYLSHLVSHS